MSTQRIAGITFHTMTLEAMRAEQVRLWGEEKVAANEAQVRAAFPHLYPVKP